MESDSRLNLLKLIHLGVLETIKHMRQQCSLYRHSQYLYFGVQGSISRNNNLVSTSTKVTMLRDKPSDLVFGLEGHLSINFLFLILDSEVGQFMFRYCLTHVSDLEISGSISCHSRKENKSAQKQKNKTKERNREVLKE